MVKTAIEPDLTLVAVPAESVRKRYGATLAGQLVQFAAAGVAAAIVPRQLGPAAFGNYTFLLGMAATLRGFSEPSVQQAFYTFSSQERRTGSLTRAYGAWLFCQLALLLALIPIAAWGGFAQWLWPGQQFKDIVLITIVDWTTFLALSLRQLGDSKGLTVRGQKISVLASAATVATLGVLWFEGLLTFQTYGLLNIAAATIQATVLAQWLFIARRDECWAGDLSVDLRRHVRRWWAYAKPLIAIEYYTPIAAFAGTYLLQLWYGSVEQGGFGLASRWCALVLVSTSAGLMIFWRETAKAIAQNDWARAGAIYDRFSRLLFVVTAIFCVWLSAASRTLVVAVAGAQYRNAVPVLAIMAFYPLAQTYGQLNAAVLKASERTARFRNLVLLLSIPDVAITYILLAPSTALVPGLGLGAVGVALKTAGYTLISVQAYELSSRRLFGQSYLAALVERLRVLGIVGLLGVIILVKFSEAIEGTTGALAALAVASAVYGTAIVAMLLIVPGMFGLRRAELSWQS
jgi:O-antigen/teichoic acid export membrane protein